MKAKTTLASCFFATALFLPLGLVIGQEAAPDNAIGYINARLAHSSIMKIDPDGLVSINAPDQTIKFNIKEVSFNYNGLNNDDRVRILGDYCIEIYQSGHREETLHRQSFLCKSKSQADEAIKVFNRLKKQFIAKDNRYKNWDMKLNVGDPSIGYTRMNEAFDYINDKLVHSVIVKVDDKGIMVINSPSNVYKVDLKKAEFCFNDSGGEPKVRVYGEWCVELYSDATKEKNIPRESFLARSRGNVYQVIKAMYYIKSTATGFDPAKVDSLRNVSRAKVYRYTSIPEAIDYINDRLEISIITSIDNAGILTINATDNIFQLNVADCTFGQSSADYDILGFIKFTPRANKADAVLIKCRNGIRQMENCNWDKNLDEQDFKCKSHYDVQDIITAFNFIRDKLKSAR